MGNGERRVRSEGWKEKREEREERGENHGDLGVGGGRHRLPLRRASEHSALVCTRSLRLLRIIGGIRYKTGSDCLAFFAGWII